MALPVRFSLLHSDLNDFLFAAVGEEQNGVTLSVVSGLIRLGLDSISISVDGLRDTHDRVRGVKGSFDRTMTTIQTKAESAQRKSFKSPDETRPFKGKGKLELVKFGDTPIGRATSSPAGGSRCRT